jgi:hypothetical protein
MRIQVLLFAVLLSPALQAQETDENQGKVIEKPVVADTPETFATQTEWIENEMKDGGRYEFTKAADKQRVHVLLGQMGNLLQRSGSVAAMDQSTKVALFNDQEEVNGILKHNDSNRLVCQSIKPIGSNIPQTHCHTYGQLEQTRRYTKMGMEQYDSSRKCGAVAGAGTHQVSAGPNASMCSGQ